MFEEGVLKKHGSQSTEKIPRMSDRRSIPRATKNPTEGNEPAYQFLPQGLTVSSQKHVLFMLVKHHFSV